MWLTEALYARPDGSFAVADIEVEGGTIAQIAPPAHRAGAVDCSARVVIPGLVNGHFHSQTSLLRGLDDGLELFDWFGDSAAGRRQGEIGAWLDDPSNVDEVAAVVRHEYVELLRQGVTFVGDSGCSELSPAVLAAAGDAAGLRVVPQAYDDWIERLDDRERYTVNIEPEEDLTPAALDRASAYDGVRFAMHCLESRQRREIVEKNWGMSTVRLLAERDLLAGTILFHACEIDADDLALIVSSGASIMHCPVSNLAIHGKAPAVPEWVRAGATIGLGTDWGDLDMWSTIRTAYLLVRTSRAEVLRMATRGGALGYGRDDLGEIAVGRAADLVFLDTERLRPYEERTIAFAIFAAGGPARDVMVGGDWVIRDGVPTRIDAGAVLADYRRICTSLGLR
ncbi:amidohydrolase family protein [Fodinicola acaciae]|uniref:amidohydrolase family protein n=1 Tax=Fodinicola acaciae TaxID=2681555 RepID=UPI0013D720D2|nr:amidohydrolase family protein [Fodinicola acaciae]